MKKFTAYLIFLLLILWVFSLDFDLNRSAPQYGVSFSRFHADELKLDWKETYLAMLDDLGVRNFRFSAHWPLTEPQENIFNFKELDFQFKEAEKRNASVILAVGHRLPGWPECHEPEWITTYNSNLKTQNQEKFRNEKLLEYITAVVDRYKNYDNLKYWQVENEPFLGFFGRSACGELNKEFLREEISLVKRLDPARPVMITDSGEFGGWFRAYKEGDAFGTTMYLYVWNRTIGPLRYPVIPAFFRIKKNIISLIYGEKPSIVIELSTEPWLLQPILDTPVDTQLERMGLEKFNEMINFSSKTGFDSFYLWGAEWWYWMKQSGHPEFWEQARGLFHES